MITVLNFIKKKSPFSMTRSLLIPTKLEGLRLRNQLYNLKRLSLYSSNQRIGANLRFHFKTLTAPSKSQLPHT